LVIILTNTNAFDTVTLEFDKEDARKFIHTHTHTHTHTHVFVSVKVNENILHKIRNTQKSLRYVGLCLMDDCEYMKAQNYLHANHSLIKPLPVNLS
jgi:hypothetical protein